MSNIGDLGSLALTALNGSLSSTTSKSDRENYDRFIQQLKESQECLPILTNLLNQDCSEFVKLLAITILNDWIKIWWNKILEVDQLSVRKVVFDIISSPLGLSTNKSIRTKIAVIVTNIAQRHFPQYWPNFVDEFVGVWKNTSSASLQDIVVMSFEFLIVDCIDSDFNNTLPTLRRQEIVAGIKEKQELILSTAFSCLTFHLNIYCNSPQGTDESSQSKNIVQSIVKLLIALASLIKTEEICTAEHNFLAMLLNMVNIPHIQVATIELLQVLCSQKLSIDLFSTLLLGFQRNGFISTLPEDLQDSVAFQRNYAQTMIGILSHNTAVVFDSIFLSDAGAVSCVHAYMGILMQYLKLPSRRLACDIVKDFLKIYKDELVVNFPQMEEFAMNILSEYMLKCKKPLWLEIPNNSAIQPDDVFELEFEEQEEWAEFYGMFKSQIKLLAECIVARYTITAMNTLSSYVRHLIAQQQAISAKYNIDGAVASAGAQNKASNNAKMVENKSLSLDFDVFYTIYMPLFYYITPPSAEKSEIKHEYPQSSAIDFKQVETCMSSLLTTIFAWVPNTTTDALFVIEKFKLIACHNVLLKLFPIEYIAQIYTLYFDALNLTAASADVNGGITNLNTSNVGLIKGKAATSIAVLTVVVADNIVKSSFLDSFLTQINTILTTVPEKGIQTNMRETLISLSENIADNNLKARILNHALSDIVQRLNTVDGSGSSYLSVFQGPEALLQTVLRVCAENNNSGNVKNNNADNTGNNNSTNSNNTMLDIRNLLNTIFLTAKRVKSPTVPVEVYTQQRLVVMDDLRQIFPFADVWLSCLPAIYQGMKTLHEIWQPALRGMILTQLQQQSAQSPDRAQAELLNSALYTIQPVEVSKICSKNTTNSALSTQLMSTYSYKIHFELRETRIFLYQLLAQAAVHKVIYLYEPTRAFLDEIVKSLEYMDNSHLLLFCKYFMEPFVLNALPCSYSYVSQFMATFLNTTLVRIRIAWDKDAFQQRNLLSPDMRILYEIYYNCANAVTATTDEIEIVHDSMVNDFTRFYCDLLAKYLSIKGYLVITTPVAALATAANTTSNTAVAVASTISNEEMVENMYKKARQDALHSLFLHKSVPFVTKPFVETIIAMLCLPDSATCRSCLALAQFLLAECAKDNRFVSVIAKEAFSAALCVLLKQEKWSIGLEWELIEFLLDIYLTFSLGVTDKTDNATAAVLLVTANDNGKGWNTNTFDKSKHNSGMKGNNNSNKNNSNTDLTTLMSGNKIITEVPKQLLLEIPGVTSQKLKSLDKQLLTLLSKKKRRGIFKDFVTDILALNGQINSDSLESKGGMFAQTVPKILDIKHKLIKFTNKAKKATENYDLTNLFDDPDL